jgi:hypothetical protein
MARPFTVAQVQTYPSWELRDRNEGGILESVHYVSPGPDREMTYWGRSDSGRWVLVRKAKHPGNDWEGIYQ